MFTPPATHPTTLIFYTRPGLLYKFWEKRGHSYPFVEESDKAIAFRFASGHVFHHPAISEGK